MVKNCFAWQKILIRGSALAFAAVAGFACLTAFAPAGARAASFADDYSIGDLVIANDLGSGTEYESANIYGDFQLAFSHYQESTCNAARSAWLNYRETPGYYEYMVQYEINNPGSEEYGVRWYFGWDATKPTGAFNVYQTTGATLNFTGNFKYRITFVRGSSGGTYMQSTTNPNMYIGLTCSNSSGTVNNPGFIVRNASGWHQYRPIFSRNIDITYPAGFEGPEIPYNYQMPNPPNEAIPAVKMRGFSNWKGNFADDNFSTFDEVPFTCDGGLAPVIHGELWNVEGTPVKLDDYTASATGIFTLDLPKENSDTDYKLISWYDCSDGVNIFPDNQHYEFTITPSGGLKTAQLHETCMSTDFPFIHFEECMETIFSAIEIMFFGNVQFGNLPVTPEGCYTLTTVGHWINLENKQICPSYSPTVRNIITPIVLFLCGLAFVRIINRRDVVDG